MKTSTLMLVIGEYLREDGLVRSIKLVALDLSPRASPRFWGNFGEIRPPQPL